MGRREFDMKKYVIVCVAALLVSSATAFAQDPLVPDWRGENGTTWQVWEFSTDNADLVPPDAGVNDFGDPLLQVDTSLDWISDDQGRMGVWPLFGELNVYLPNDPTPNDEKLMRIQLTWKPGDNNPSPFVPSIPAIAVVPFSDITMTVAESIQLENGWETMVLDIVMHPNPPEEWVTVEGDILVDRLVIDTYCWVPEPMTMALLAFGGLVLYRRRRA